MRAVGVEFELPSGERRVLGPGDIIGRMPSAALRLDDPRISEAHALVSLRGERLKLLALRGALLLGGKPRSELILGAGSQVMLAEGLRLNVLSVVLPDWALALEGVAHAPVALTSSVYSVVLGTGLPQAVLGYRVDAAALIWSTGEGWMVRVGEQEAHILDTGELVAGVRAVRVALASTSAEVTAMTGRLSVPLRLVTRFDTAQIDRKGWPTLHVGGKPARILAELAMIGGPASWEVVAREIWTGDVDRGSLRTRWDRSLNTLRGKLRAANLRTDLVRSCGSGNVELLLHENDTVIDRS